MVYCWGYNGYGQLGYGRSDGGAAVPAPKLVYGSDIVPWGGIAGDACASDADCGEDGDACTVATCDANTGKCAQIAAPNGVACDDGNACTTSDACKSGACQGAAVACD